MQLSSPHGFSIASLVDTPSLIVEPDTEATALVRQGSGLGAMAMTGGGFHEIPRPVAWPTGEFVGMGLEGAVRLGYRKEL